MILPQTLYVVVTDFDKIAGIEVGIGGAGDITASRDDAYDQYVEAVLDEQPTRAFRLDFDVETNRLESASEITDDMRDELVKLCKEREIDIPEVL